MSVLGLLRSCQSIRLNLTVQRLRAMPVPGPSFPQQETFEEPSFRPLPESIRSGLQAGGSASPRRSCPVWGVMQRSPFAGVTVSGWFILRLPAKLVPVKTGSGHPPLIPLDSRFRGSDGVSLVAGGKNASSLISCDSIWSASTDAVQLRPHILFTLRVAGLASRAGSSPERRR